VGQLNSLVATGLLSDPFVIANQWRYRRPIFRVQKSLLYHRYATALLLAHEVGLLEALAERDHTVQTAARACRLKPRAADSLLRILVSEGIANVRRDQYRLSRFGRLYLIGDGRFSISPMLDMMAAQAAAFAQLPEALGSGETPDALDIFSPEGRYRAFLRSVNSYLHWASQDLLTRLNLPRINHFIVGSMGVSFSAALMKRVPSAEVTYGCLEHLVAEIPDLIEQYEVPKERVRGMHAHGGNPAKDRWGDESFDLVFLTKKMILEPKQRMGEKFARKAYQVLRPGGMAIFWETIHPDHGRMPLARAMEAVLDLGASPDGTVNTESGLFGMLKKIGYRDVELVDCLGGMTTFAVARK
jgi:hypothetical protein